MNAQTKIRHGLTRTQTQNKKINLFCYEVVGFSCFLWCLCDRASETSEEAIDLPHWHDLCSIFLFSIASKCYFY